MTKTLQNSLLSASKRIQRRIEKLKKEIGSLENEHREIASQLPPEILTPQNQPSNS